MKKYKKYHLLIETDLSDIEKASEDMENGDLEGVEGASDDFSGALEGSDDGFGNEAGEPEGPVVSGSEESVASSVQTELPSSQSESYNNIIRFNKKFRNLNEDISRNKIKINSDKIKVNSIEYFKNLFGSNTPKTSGYVPTSSLRNIPYNRDTAHQAQYDYSNTTPMSADRPGPVGMRIGNAVEGDRPGSYGTKVHTDTMPVSQEMHGIQNKDISDAGHTAQYDYSNNSPISGDRPGPVGMHVGNAVEGDIPGPRGVTPPKDTHPIPPGWQNDVASDGSENNVGVFKTLGDTIKTNWKNASGAVSTFVKDNPNTTLGLGAAAAALGAYALWNRHKRNKLENKLINKSLNASFEYPYYNEYNYVSIDEDLSRVYDSFDNAIRVYNVNSKAPNPMDYALPVGIGVLGGMTIHSLIKYLLSRGKKKEAEELNSIVKSVDNSNTPVTEAAITSAVDSDNKSKRTGELSLNQNALTAGISAFGAGLAHGVASDLTGNPYIGFGAAAGTYLLTASALIKYLKKRNMNKEAEKVSNIVNSASSDANAVNASFEYPYYDFMNYNGINEEELTYKANSKSSENLNASYDVYDRFANLIGLSEDDNDTNEAETEKGDSTVIDNKPNSGTQVTGGEKSTNSSSTSTGGSISGVNIGGSHSEGGSANATNINHINVGYSGHPDSLRTPYRTREIVHRQDGFDTVENFYSDKGKDSTPQTPPTNPNGQGSGGGTPPTNPKDQRKGRNQSPGSDGNNPQTPPSTPNTGQGSGTNTPQSTPTTAQTQPQSSGTNTPPSTPTTGQGQGSGGNTQPQQKLRLTNDGSRGMVVDDKGNVVGRESLFGGIKRQVRDAFIRRADESDKINASGDYEVFTDKNGRKIYKDKTTGETVYRTNPVSNWLRNISTKGNKKADRRMGLADSVDYVLSEYNRLMNSKVITESYDYHPAVIEKYNEDLCNLKICMDIVLTEAFDDPELPYEVKDEMNHRLGLNFDDKFAGCDFGPEVRDKWDSYINEPKCVSKFDRLDDIRDKCCILNDHKLAMRICAVATAATLYFMWKKFSEHHLGMKPCEDNKMLSNVLFITGSLPNKLSCCRESEDIMNNKGLVNDINSLLENEYYVTSLVMNDLSIPTIFKNIVAEGFDTSKYIEVNTKNISENVNNINMKKKIIF